MFDTSLSREKLKAMKETNHAEALRKLISSRCLDYVEKSASSSTASGSDPSGNPVTMLIQ